MSNAEHRISEDLAVLGYRGPVSTSAGAVNGTAIDMRFFRRLNFKVMTGLVAANGTLDFKLQCSVDGSTNWEDIPGKAITQFDEDSDEMIAQIDLQAEENRLVADDEARRYVRFVLTIATAASVCAILVVGDVARYNPAMNYNLAAVVETVE